MISEQTKQLLLQLLAEQPTYRPKQAVLDQIKGKRMVCLVGASCMGKTTIMDTLVRLDPRFGKSRNFTSRPPRADDDTSRYYYYEHSDKGLKPIFDSIRSGELLQYNINPHTLHVYGSEASGYPHDINLGDIFSSSIDGFRQLGFGDVRVVTIVTDPSVWQTRINARFPVGSERREARLKEAVTSLEWSLAQTNPDHSFIINYDGEAEAAAKQLHATLNGTMPNQEEARRLAEACLAKAKEMLT